MEDLSTTAQAFTKDELAAMCRHPVVVEVEHIQAVRLLIDSLINDTSKSRDDISIEIRSLFDSMSESWRKLGPSRLMARRLYPELISFFDILDKSLSVHDALDDMRNGRNFRKDEPCDLLCCRKQLKQNGEAGKCSAD